MIFKLSDVCYAQSGTNIWASFCVDNMWSCSSCLKSSEGFLSSAYFEPTISSSPNSQLFLQCWLQRRGLSVWCWKFDLGTWTLRLVIFSQDYVSLHSVSFWNNKESETQRTIVLCIPTTNNNYVRTVSTLTNIRNQLILQIYTPSLGKLSPGFFA